MKKSYRVNLSEYCEPNEGGMAASDSDTSLVNEWSLDDIRKTGSRFGDGNYLAHIDLTPAEVATLKASGTLVIGDEIFVDDEIDSTAQEKIYRQWDREGR